MSSTPKELHISIDFETLAAKSTRPAMLSIGLVIFDPNWTNLPTAVASVATLPSLHLKLSTSDPSQTEQYGRVIEPDTLDWWSKQDGEAKKLLDECAASPLTFASAFRGLNTWLEQLRLEHADADGTLPELHAWSYGAKSDLVWWATACEALGIEYPIHYRNEHCLRTLAGELPFVERVEYGVKHNALDDAIGQAAWIQRLRAALRAAVPAAEPVSAMPAVDPALLFPSVQAKAHDDSYVHEVTFDAAAWFAQASDDEILGLYGIGWGGDEEADNVALFFEGSVPEIKDMLDFCRATRNTTTPIGFECTVDDDHAMVWLRTHRPGLWAIILCEDNDVDLVEAQEPEILGRWDWLDSNGNASECSLETKQDAALAAVATLGLDD